MKINNSEILPEKTHDEAARLNFVASLRAHLSGKIMPGNYEIYESRIEPAIAEKTGSTAKRPPSNPQDHDTGALLSILERAASS